MKIHREAIDPYLVGQLKMRPSDQQPELFFNYEAVSRLVRAGIQLLRAQEYRPDYIICIPNGSAHFASQFGDYFGMNCAYLSASSYDHTSPASAGVQRDGVSVSNGITYVSKGGSIVELPNQLIGNVLILDDLRQSNRTATAAATWLRERYGQQFRLTTLFLLRKKYDAAPLPAGNLAVADLEFEPNSGTMPWVVWPWEEEAEKLRREFPWPKA